MPLEIERKFLVKPGAWENAEFTTYRQGYLHSSEQLSVRVRSDGRKGWLAVKGPTVGPTRSEYEYEIPLDEADEMLDTLCGKPLIEKQRYIVMEGESRWEVDRFFGENAGLVVAEIELENEHQPFEKPDWLGAEVTDDPRYYNSNLAKTPYCDW